MTIAGSDRLGDLLLSHRHIDHDDIAPLSLAQLKAAVTELQRAIKDGKQELEAAVGGFEPTLKVFSAELTKLENEFGEDFSLIDSAQHILETEWGLVPQMDSVGSIREQCKEQVHTAVQSRTSQDEYLRACSGRILRLALQLSARRNFDIENTSIQVHDSMAKQLPTMKAAIVSGRTAELLHALRSACHAALLLPDIDYPEALEAFKTYIDAVDLYSRLVTTQLPELLELVSPAAVHYSDVTLFVAWLSFECFPEISIRFPQIASELRDIALDAARRWLVLAEIRLQAVFEKQKALLHEILDDCNIPKRHKADMSRIKKALDQAILFVTKAYAMCEDILSPDAVVVTVGRLFDATCRWLTNGIIDIPSLEGDLPKQFTSLGHELSALGTGMFGSPESISETIPEFGRLAAIVGLLGMNLLQIINAYRRGQFSGKLFPLELEKLIRAIFSDSALRRTCLSEIMDDAL